MAIGFYFHVNASPGDDLMASQFATIYELARHLWHARGATEVLNREALIGGFATLKLGGPATVSDINSISTASLPKAATRAK